MPLFLFNYSNRQLHGVFEAAANADWELEPTGAHHRKQHKQLCCASPYCRRLGDLRSTCS